jgi:RimJ/RimL family protein N-acetyltransferase
VSREAHSSLLRDGRTLAVERAVPGDAAAIVGYLERVAGESPFLTFGPGDLNLTVARETAIIERLATRGTGFMLEGVVDGEVVSVATVMRVARPRVRHAGELGVSVLRALWGRGVGRAMCQAAIAEARTAGMRKLNLRVREDNTRAIALYDSLGFVREGRLDRAILENDRFHAELAMGLLID